MDDSVKITYKSLTIGFHHSKEIGEPVTCPTRQGIKLKNGNPVHPKKKKPASPTCTTSLKLVCIKINRLSGFRYPESEVDARTYFPGCFWYMVLIIILHRFTH